jgi:hypothetical protein
MRLGHTPADDHGAVTYVSAIWDARSYLGCVVRRKAQRLVLNDIHRLFLYRGVGYFFFFGGLLEAPPRALFVLGDSSLYPSAFLPPSLSAFL